MGTKSIHPFSNQFFSRAWNDNTNCLFCAVYNKDNKHIKNTLQKFPPVLYDYMLVFILTSRKVELKLCTAQYIIISHTNSPLSSLVSSQWSSRHLPKPLGSFLPLNKLLIYCCTALHFCHPVLKLQCRASKPHQSYSLPTHCYPLPSTAQPGSGVNSYPSYFRVNHLMHVSWLQNQEKLLLIHLIKHSLLIKYPDREVIFKTTQDCRY